MKTSVIFRYSLLYDKILRKKNYGKKRTQILKSAEIPDYVEKVDELWKNKGSEILLELTAVTRLKWEEDIIVCYVVGNSIPFPDPLTIPAYKGLPDYFIDILIHELIERLFLQRINRAKMQKVLSYFYQKYAKEHRITKNHIPVHALFSHVMMRFFDEKRLEREREWISYLSPYKKSWDIVTSKGYHEIINEFRDLTI